jgi:hypothetical protein
MLRSQTRRLFLLTVVSGALGAAALSPSAWAATQRYAIPGGGGTDCSAAVPCKITTAVQGAHAGDEVILNPGDYPMFDDIVDPAPITIHGVAGQPRPRVLFTGPQFVSLHTGSVLRYVEIDQTVPGAIWATSALLDQVIVRAPNYPLFIDSSTVRNSIVVATAPGGVAIRSNSSSISNSVLRNVTAIATASGGVAVDAFAMTVSGSVNIGANNVIARGGPGGASFSVRTDNVGGHAIIGIGHSAYSAGTLYKSGSNADFTYGGGNLGLAPIFVDPATGDYRQALGSPTIDAGSDDVRNGELDVDGDARVNGKTDIGADEFVSAPAGGTATGGGTGPASGATDPSPTQSTLPPAAGFAGVRLVSTRLTMSGRFITLRLSCPAGTAGRCSGRTKLSASRRRTPSRPAATVLLGRAPFSIGAGRQARVRVRVSRAGRRLLSTRRRVRGKDANTARDGTGQTKGTVVAVTIRRRPR